ncbi:hypothetical protein JA1_005453 [Spathaspora sp. JA1]|nr:hypothetical protein JA1_005453 [Spathaspora sp. JA1]
MPPFKKKNNKKNSRFTTYEREDKSSDLVEKQRKRNSESNDPTVRIGHIIDGTSNTTAYVEQTISQIRTRCVIHAAKNEGKIGVTEIQSIASSHLVGSALAWLDVFMRPYIDNLMDDNGKLTKAHTDFNTQIFLDALRTRFGDKQSKFSLSVEVSKLKQGQNSFSYYRSEFRNILDKFLPADTLEQESYITTLFRQNANVKYQPIVANIKTYNDIDEIVERPELEFTKRDWYRNKDDDESTDPKKFCQNCGKDNHYTNQCRLPPKKNNNKTNNKKNNNNNNSNEKDNII